MTLGQTMRTLYIAAAVGVATIAGGCATSGGPVTIGEPYSVHTDYRGTHVSTVYHDGKGGQSNGGPPEQKKKSTLSGNATIGELINAMPDSAYAPQ